MKKTIFLTLVLISLTFSVLAEGNQSAGGKTCPNNQQNCLMIPPTEPDTQTEDSATSVIFKWFSKLFEIV